MSRNCAALLVLDKLTGRRFCCEMPGALMPVKMQKLELMERFSRCFAPVTTGLLLLSCSGSFGQVNDRGVQKWGRFEQTLESSVEYKNPVQEAALTAIFKSP